MNKVYERAQKRWEALYGETWQISELTLDIIRNNFTRLHNSPQTKVNGKMVYSPEVEAELETNREFAKSSWMSRNWMMSELNKIRKEEMTK